MAARVFQATSKTERFLCRILGIWCRPVYGRFNRIRRRPTRDRRGAGGDLSAPEAAGLTKVIQGFTQALNTADLDKRIAELERRMKK